MVPFRLEGGLCFWPGLWYAGEPRVPRGALNAAVRYHPKQSRHLDPSNGFRIHTWALESQELDWHAGIL